MRKRGNISRRSAKELVAMEGARRRQNGLVCGRRQDRRGTRGGHSERPCLGRSTGRLGEPRPRSNGANAAPRGEQAPGHHAL